MLVKELPNTVAWKTFANLHDLVDFLYNKQIITEYGTLSSSEITPEISQTISQAKNLPDSEFVNV